MKQDKTPFTVYHIGDLHFWSIPISPFAYVGKRILGVGNLVVGGRAKKFKQSMASILAERLSQPVDQFLFSGDFSSTAISAEFTKARKALLPAIQKSGAKTLSVPGNHDCYTPKEIGAELFADTLGNEFGPVKSFLFQEISEGVFVYCINATTINGMKSFGRISSDAVEDFHQVVLPRKNDLKTLIILCHFPGEDPSQAKLHDRGVQLMGTEAFLNELNELPCRILWLHGHHHYRWIYGSPSVENLTYLNAGAPMLKRKHCPADLGFHELQFIGEELKIKTHHYEDAKWQSQDVDLPSSGNYISLQ